VVGFLHYASPASTGTGYGPTAVACSDGSYTNSSLLITTPQKQSDCNLGPDGQPDTADDVTFTGGPLIFYLQDGVPTGLVNIKPGASSINNEDYALFAQDKWQILPNLSLSYGL